MSLTIPRWITGTCFGLLALMAVTMVGCSDREEPKKVSILVRSPISESPDQTKVADASLKFGFDHRLSPKDDVRIYLSFIQYMGRQREKYEETADNLGRGLIQFAALGPVNYVAAKAKYGVDCLAMGLNQDGKPEYRGVVFTRQDSSINRLEDLRGKAFAFGDRFSTQGHVIPRQMLEGADHPGGFAELRLHRLARQHGQGRLERRL